MAYCLVSLGSNLGDRTEMLDAALALLRAHAQVDVLAVSRFHQTTAVGGPSGQGDFLNGAALLDTSLSPRQLLALLRRTERRMGRRTGPRWAPRVVDLDLLLYDDLVVSSPSLQLPHPRMAFRRFVLAPAAEVAPHMTHPPTGWTVRRLLEHLDAAANYIAVAGAPGTGKSRLVRQVARQTGADAILDPPRPRQGRSTSQDSSGRELDRELEFVRRRARLLAQRPVSQTPSLSDFWFDQCRAYARLSLAGTQFEQFEQQWRRTRRSVPAPKLLVLLEASAEWLAARSAERASLGETEIGRERLDLLQREMARQAFQSGQGPVLRLDAAGDEDWAAVETAAALEAMR